MKKALWIALCLCLLLPAGLAEGGALGYRFADAREAAALRLANRDYFESLNRNDLSFRMQKTDATLEEYEAFAAAQLQDYTDDEKAAIDRAMAEIEAVCAERGYALPAMDDIVFAKSTMADECDAGGYTHGTQIYLSGDVTACGLSEDPDTRAFFTEIVAHELFHALTRNHPDFRAAMYGILGFTVTGEDFALAPSIREKMISNPDVEHHDAYAAFEIGGETRDCVVVFTTTRPFEQPGDTFFSTMATGLVPVDALDSMYDASEAANFWDVFGRNTGYVIDPEETLADNFSFLLTFGVDGMDYATPGIIEAIDAYLKGSAAAEAAA